MSQSDLTIAAAMQSPEARRAFAAPSALWESMRPLQWSKNGFVLLPLLFGNRFLDPVAIAYSLVATLYFCAFSSAVYLINDCWDREWDASHPDKRRRPIASGRLGVRPALVAAAALVAFAGAWSILLDLAFFGLGMLYVVWMLAYCVILKRIPGIDVISISVGFVIRALAGAIVLGLVISPWLVICTAALTLLLGFGKRRGELARHGEAGARARPVLAYYPLALLDALVGGSVIACGAAYIGYCLASDSGRQHPLLLFSAPFVLIGIARYLWHVYRGDLGEAPDEILHRDRWFLLNGACYLVAVLLALTQEVA